MSDQVQVKIRGMVITQRYGSLNTGDILRTDAAFAKHLVEECGAAEYIAAPVAEEEAVLKDGEAIVPPVEEPAPVEEGLAVVEEQPVPAKPKSKSKQV